MCGITGFLNLDGAPADEASASQMAEALAHRGPDGSGSWAEGPMAMGHRRLAILDLSPAGEQPMTSRDGRFVLVYNGEVFNFRELRAELDAAGHEFRSSGDTEVVLNALAEWGTEALLRFNGMFALALWDRQRSELLLARDRVGIKPLYWALNGATLTFGSEAKAILRHPSSRADLDPEALLEYFTFQNLFTQRTLFEGISLLPAGSFIRVDRHESKPKVERYWDFNFAEPESSADEAELLEELDRLFRQAVGRQLVSDVPVGSYLSGGHGLRLDHGDRGVPARRDADLHGGVRYELGIRNGARLRRA